MFNVSLVGDRAIVARFAAFPKNVHDYLLKKVSVLALKLESKIKTQKLSGQVLNVKTGALRRSIAHQIKDTLTAITAKVFSSGDVKYAGIHEFGGTTKPHDIVATKAKALHFVMGGKEMFLKRVHHPGSKMPERSFMRSSLSEMQPEIVEALEDAGKMAWTN